MMVDKKNLENSNEPGHDNEITRKEHERKVKKLKEKVEKDVNLEKEKSEKEELKQESDGQEDSLIKEDSANSEEEDNKTRYLRLAADFANYKKRSERERSSIHAYANEKLVTDMLDILDNFDRAFTQEDFENQPFADGMVLIYKQLLDVLQRAGLSEINAKGQPFDPEFHDALMMEPSPDCESGQIIEVFKKGYMMNKKVIRPTLVKVAQ